MRKNITNQFHSYFKKLKKIEDSLYSELVSEYPHLTEQDFISMKRSFYTLLIEEARGRIRHESTFERTMRHYFTMQERIEKGMKLNKGIKPLHKKIKEVETISPIKRLKAPLNKVEFDMGLMPVSKTIKIPKHLEVHD